MVGYLVSLLCFSGQANVLTMPSGLDEGTSLWARESVSLVISPQSSIRELGNFHCLGFKGKCSVQAEGYSEDRTDRVHDS